MFTNTVRRANIFAKATQKNFATLVLAEHFEGKLNANLGSLLTAASQLKDT
jgi:hypothetical protein